MLWDAMKVQGHRLLEAVLDTQGDAVSYGCRQRHHRLIVDNKDLKGV